MEILCAVSFVLSIALVALNGFRGLWYFYVLILDSFLVDHFYQVRPSTVKSEKLIASFF